MEFGNGEANSFRGEEENEVMLNQRNSPIICTGTSRKMQEKSIRREENEAKFDLAKKTKKKC